MCLTGQSHESPVVFRCLQLKACQHTPRNTPGHSWAWEQKLQYNCVTGWLCLLLHCGTFSGALAAPAQIDSQKWPKGPSPDSSERPSSLCNHSSLSSPQRGNQGDFLYRTATFLGWKDSVSGNMVFQCNHESGCSQSYSTKRKNRESFCLAPSRSCAWNRNDRHHTYLHCLSLTPKVAHVSWHYWIFVVFTYSLFFLCACNSFLFENHTYLFTSPRDSSELPHPWCLL